LTFAVAAQAEPPTLQFSKRCLIIDMNEGCAAADVNRDGKLDLIAGEHWYAAPDFIPRPVRAIPPVDKLPAYLNGELLQNTGDLPYDVDGDGWIDVISVGWTHQEMRWYKNPGGTRPYDEHPWPAHVLGPIRGFTESIMLHDFDGDGRPEIFVNCFRRNLPQVILRLVKDDKGQPAIQEVVLGPANGHGYAFGDVNGDGREDILYRDGWFERPAGNVFTAPWKFHPETALSTLAPTPFVVTRLTDSGRNDIVWGKAHDYGLYWWEQGVPRPDGTTTWTEHLIDKSWSQTHVMAWADLDGDGQPELITGKRVRAHVDKDPGSADPECLYYYQWDKAARKFTRHTIAAPGQGVGTGMQICVADLNADGRPDIAVAGKTGTWILFNAGRKK
jgi:hypothetical protein